MNAIRSIPLYQLQFSRSNVRKTDRLADIQQLAQSICANGLLENLVVVAVPTTKDEPAYEVIAGGRRLAALRQLAKQKAVPRDFDVACKVVEAASKGQLAELSLTENVVRTPLHPADQFEAFAKLSKLGMPSDDIAARFGVMPVFVQQRLKLASVSPKLVAEYRAGSMTLEQLMAFTVSDDRKAQEQVWFDNVYRDLPASMIRHMLTRSKVSADDKRVRLVALDSYLAAGGTVLRDLFQQEDEGYLEDSQLLDRLVGEKLKAAADALTAEGWSWVEVHVDSEAGALSRFGRIQPTESELSPEDENRLTELCDRYDELVALVEEEGEDENSKELDIVSTAIDDLRDQKEAWSAEDKGGAGAVATIAFDGSLQLLRGLVARSKATASSRAEEETESSDQESAEYAASLMVDLSAHTTAALQEVLASKPDMALTALLFALVGHLFRPGRATICVDVFPSTPDLAHASPFVAEGRAAIAFAARLNRWTERIPDDDSLWDWLQSLDHGARLDLLACCVAMTVNALEGTQAGSVRRAAARDLAGHLAVDLSDWWRPTARAFLMRLTKAQIVSAVQEGVSEEAARDLVDMKKDRLADKAENLLANTKWLPASMRLATSDAPDINESA